MKRFLLLCGLVFGLSGCGDGEKDYVRIIGGGLTFNYRYSQATMIVVAKQISPAPEGSRVEAEFDIPGETSREKVSRPVMAGKITYKLESKYLTGIKKGVPLKVTLRMLDPVGKELDRVDTEFVSDVDQDTLPTKPLVDPAKPNYVPQLENL